jgi:hypothetical protein
MKKLLMAIVVALVVMPLAFAAVTTPFINGGTQGSVSEAAVIGTTTSAPPTVQFAWVLPDEDPLTAGTQVKPTINAQRNDIYACVVVGDTAYGRDNIQNVYVDVYHPTGTGAILPCVASAGHTCDNTTNTMVTGSFGTMGNGGKPYDRTTLFKYQVHAVKLDPIVDRAAIENCKTLAKAAGLITQAQYDQIDYNIFSQPIWYMYKVSLPMLYHQPSGLYTIKAWATDTASAVSAQLTNTFTWVSTVALDIDFAAGVNYGSIQPSVYKVVQGDYNLVAGDNMPTIKNEGNERVNIALTSTTLHGAVYGKDITDFDAKWDPNELGYGYGMYYFQAGTKVNLADPIELCQTEKIDLSVRAPIGLPQDTYTGTLTLEATAASH